MKLGEISPIHVIAVNQVIDTPKGRSPNPKITDWVIQLVDGNANIGMIHKRNEDGRFEVTSDFGEAVFDSIFDARDWVESKYLVQRSRMN